MNGWSALILAAGRGPDDPMAKAYGVANKCLIPVGGVPMLTRVVSTLSDFGPVLVSIESGVAGQFETVEPYSSAPSSVLAAVRTGRLPYPVLVTTGDHPLLTREMLDHFRVASETTGADFTAGLARAEVIEAAWPETRRTYFSFRPDRVSGCNLFALHNSNALRILERWQYLEQVRKKPWRLVAAFGVMPLLRYLSGTLTLETAFATASKKLGLVMKPVLMPQAEAAIDVDKPADKDLAEKILAGRDRVPDFSSYAGSTRASSSIAEDARVKRGQDEKS